MFHMLTRKYHGLRISYSQRGKVYAYGVKSGAKKMDDDRKSSTMSRVYDIGNQNISWIHEFMQRWFTCQLSEMNTGFVCLKVKISSRKKESNNKPRIQMNVLKISKVYEILNALIN